MKVDYRCEECGSNDIVWDADAQWNPNTQKMELQYLYDLKTHCINCEKYCKVNQIEYKP